MLAVFPDWPYFSKGRPDVLASWQEAEGRANKTRLEKNGNVGMELVNPSPACLLTFVQKGLKPKKTNREREVGEAKLHSQADVGR